MQAKSPELKLSGGSAQVSSSWFPQPNTINQHSQKLGEGFGFGRRPYHSVRYA